MAQAGANGAGERVQEGRANLTDLILLLLCRGPSLLGLPSERGASLPRSRSPWSVDFSSLSDIILFLRRLVMSSSLASPDNATRVPRFSDGISLRTRPTKQRSLSAPCVRTVSGLSRLLESSSRAPRSVVLAGIVDIAHASHVLRIDVGFFHQPVGLLAGDAQLLCGLGHVALRAPQGGQQVG